MLKIKKCEKVTKTQRSNWFLEIPNSQISISRKIAKSSHCEWFRVKKAPTRFVFQRKKEAKGTKSFLTTNLEKSLISMLAQSRKSMQQQRQVGRTPKWQREYKWRSGPNSNQFALFTDFKLKCWNFLILTNFETSYKFEFS